MGSNSRYLHNLASSLIGQLGIRVDTFIYNPHWFWTQHRAGIGEKVSRMSAETLGRIVACGHSEGGGKHSIHATCCGEFPVSPYMNGRQWLHALAVMVIAAEMTEILRNGNPESARGQRTSPA